MWLLPMALRAKMATVILLGIFFIPFATSDLRGLTHVLTCSDAVSASLLVDDTEVLEGPGTPPERPGGHRGRPGRARAWEMARKAVLAVARRWPDIWPPLVGTLLGFSAAAGLWCIFLLWMFNT